MVLNIVINKKIAKKRCLTFLDDRVLLMAISRLMDEGLDPLKGDFDIYINGEKFCL